MWKRLAQHQILLVPALIGLLFLAIYIRTAAPGLLSGDSAEFQLAAATLGVAHPTTYPLYTMLGALLVHLLPVGEVAWRVTLGSALAAAGAVALLAALALKLGLRIRAALVGAILLGVTPGLWNAATMAEVYALLLLLILAVGYTLVSSPKRLILIGVLAGLGFTHHGLFAIAALPVVAAWCAWQLWQQRASIATLLRQFLQLALGILLGSLPWIYPFIQYLRYGPLPGEDYGLPRHYFWGAPKSPVAVFDLLLGGAVRRGIFRFPSTDDALATLHMLQERALFEYSIVGLLLALIGLVVLWRRSWPVALAGLWVLLATSTYLFALGPAVEDAPIFTIPMLLPLALWAATGVDFILQWLEEMRLPYQAVSVVASLVLFAWLIWWGDTRVEYGSKRHLTLYRSFAEATLKELPPNAVVVAHWEQGLTLQYLRLVEGQRQDVWVDVVEPSDDPWGPRIRRRYANQPVFLIGQAPDVAHLPVELVREDEYALLFRLRETP